MAKASEESGHPPAVQHKSTCCSSANPWPGQLGRGPQRREAVKEKAIRKVQFISGALEILCGSQKPGLGFSLEEIAQLVAPQNEKDAAKMK